MRTNGFTQKQQRARIRRILSGMRARQWRIAGWEWAADDRNPRMETISIRFVPTAALDEELERILKEHSE